MNEEMIERHNSVVAKSDIVYFLGDFAFERDENVVINIVKRLNGEKHFVAGNHDKLMFNERIMKMFQSFRKTPFAEIYVEDDEARNGRQSITLCHFPMLSWNKAHHGAIHLFGHEHGNFACYENNQQLDVGVDCWDFYPASYEQIKNKLKTLPLRVINHH